MKKSKASKKAKGYSKNKVTFIFCDKYSSKNFNALFKNNTSIVQIDIYDFCQNINIEFLNNQSSISSSKYDIDLISRSKILYYPYAYESILFDPIKHDSTYHFAKRQYATLIKFIEYWLEKNDNLFDKPSVGQIWSNKIYQLESITCNLPGYRIESKIFSNYTHLKNGEVIKHISECRIIDKKNVSLGIRITDELISELSEGSALPFIAQEFINAENEFRCYVFDDNFILLSFSRNELSFENIDIHIDDKALKNPCIVSLLESHILMIKKIQELTKLRLFAVDFFCINDTDIKILEINPIPSWHWLPAKITSKIDDILSLVFQN